MPKLHKRSILNKITPSNGDMRVTYIKFPLEIVTVTNMIYFYNQFVHF